MAGRTNLKMKEAKKLKKISMAVRLSLATASLVILILSIFSFTSCCNLSSLADRLIKIQDLSESIPTVKESIDEGTSGSEGEITGEETTSSTEAATTSASEGEAGSQEYGIAYFEVTSSSESDHFEHRVGNIYAVSADGAGKKLIYSDINNKYDLGNIFGASPDGTKILGMLTEGGGEHTVPFV